MLGIILGISIVLNLIQLGIIVILFFRKCRECGRDKEIGQVFNKKCERCRKASVDKEKPKGKVGLF
jgi:hypothetical protein